MEKFELVMLTLKVAELEMLNESSYDKRCKIREATHRYIAELGNEYSFIIKAMVERVTAENRPLIERIVTSGESRAKE